MIELNTQKRELQEKNAPSHNHLDVINIWTSIQGEGPMAGEPCMFLRLAGCNLACPTCDTEYTVGRHWMHFEEIRDEILAKAPAWAKKKGETPLLVITGGEPFRQPNLIGFLKFLYTFTSFRIQIETNGMCKIEEDQFAILSMMIQERRLCVVCSPKLNLLGDGFHKIVHFWKYIISAGEVSPEDGLPLKSLGYQVPPARPPKNAMTNNRSYIFVQPEDVEDEHQNMDNLRAATESAMKFGYSISIQQHKILGVD